MADVPRPEYPRPQFVRPDWLCLNGEWEFEIDADDMGLENGLVGRALSGSITVPFCPESELSGIGNTDFMNAVWYRREVAVPRAWAGRRVLLHFQAVDYDATVWADGEQVGRHRGGFTPFTCDLGDVCGESVTLVVRARDDHLDSKPLGKQSQKPENYGCHYTRTTGIWQTVWMEPVPDVHLGRPRIVPDVAAGCFRVTQPVSQNLPGLRVRLTLSDEGGVVAATETAADLDLSPTLDLPIPKDRVRLWSTSDPHLYDIAIELIDANGNVVDSAASYAGLRSVGIDGPTVKINGQAVFQRLVLDQGYYPDGIMTAPTDEALRGDIELSMAAGFNGARLHQKVFEERFLCHADRLGYLVWGEFADWGFDAHGEETHTRPTLAHVTQWTEALHRDVSHPCIVGWCPLNETVEELTDHITDLDDMTRAMFLATKAMDVTRPVLDTSGYSHRVPEADVYDCHDYAQDPTLFKQHHSGVAEGHVFADGAKKPRSIPYGGQPFFVSEFGGIWWNPEASKDEDSWGYGDRPKSLDEFYERFERLCGVLLDDPNMFGYCYTQLTDVFQEQNGIYHFDRRPKFDLARIRAAQTRPAAIETAST
jgi:beta-galactosidase/beta-glucuronidase